MPTSSKRTGILQLIRWVQCPQNAMELFEILDGCDEAELLIAATRLKGNVGRIAWAALAKRWGYFDFQVSITSGVGGLELSFEAAAPPIHDLPQYAS